MNDIDIVIKILQEKQKFELSMKLKNSIIDFEFIDNWNGGIYDIILKVNPKFFLDLLNLEDNEKTFLLNVFKGLYYDILLSDIRFVINKDIKLDDFVYIFVDEAGNMDFSETGSKHYSFTFLVKNRPFLLYDYLQDYRFNLLEKAVEENLKLDIEAFHASYDNKFVKDEVFQILLNLPNEKLKIYSYILEKPKIIPEKRKVKDKFYIDNLIYATKKLLEELNIDKNFIIITDNLPIKQNKKIKIKAFKESINDFLKEKKLSLKYKIFHHSTASNTNLQIVDYISWAVFRKYERKDLYYYKMIKKFIIKENLLTKNRDKKYY